MVRRLVFSCGAIWMEIGMYVDVLDYYLWDAEERADIDLDGVVGVLRGLAFIETPRNHAFIVTFFLLWDGSRNE